MHDHVIHKTVKGFSMLTLGWTDGYSFIPAGFSMLSSAKESKRINAPKSGIDKRSHGWKSRMEAMMQKPQAAILLIRNALKAGIHADYVLMDTWFTNLLNGLKQGSIKITKEAKSQLLNWYVSQPAFIQEICPDLTWEV